MAVTTFIKNYRNKFNIEPTEYAFKGFDTGFYLASLMAKEYVRLRSEPQTHCDDVPALAQLYVYVPGDGTAVIFWTPVLAPLSTEGAPAMGRMYCCCMIYQKEHYI